MLRILDLGWEIAPSVQCLHYKDKDLCLITSSHIKKLGMVVYTYNPSAGRQSLRAHSPAILA